MMLNQLSYHKPGKWQPALKWKKGLRNLEIYRQYLDGVSQPKLARKYKVSSARIQQICNEVSKPIREFNAKKYAADPNWLTLMNLKAICYQLKQILEP